jgi:hypothetical protein
LAEWLFEQGIGEDRAILVEDGEIVEAAIELPGPLRAGAVLSAKLARILISGRRGIFALDDGGEALVEPLPAGLTEGAACRVEIVREPVPEAGRAKLAKARVTDAEARPGARLAERLGVHAHPHGTAASSRQAGRNCSRRPCGARSISPAERCG